MNRSFEEALDELRGGSSQIDLWAVAADGLTVHLFELKALGWSVAIDRPFACALVPMRYYGRDLRVRALMIEVRRGLYMDERSGARGPAFDEVRKRIGGALRAIASMRIQTDPSSRGGILT
jgi:N-formylglutamate amidohydrolase